MSISLFIAIVLSWVIIRYAGKAPVFSLDKWFVNWIDWFMDGLGKKLQGSFIAVEFHAVAVFVVLVAVPGVAAALLLALLGSWFWGLLGWLLGFAILLFACGREDFDLAVLSMQQNLSAQQSFRQPTTDLSDEQLAYASFDRWFSAIFWFVLFGPVFVLCYRAAALLARAENRLVLNAAKLEADKACADIGDLSIDTDDETDADSDEALIDETLVDETLVGVGSTDLSSQLGDLASRVIAILDWLPARIWTILMLLVGNFGRGLVVLREQLLSLDHGFLLWSVTSASMELDNKTEQSAHDDTARDSSVVPQINDKSFEALLAFNDRVFIGGLIFILIFAYL